MAPTIMHKKNTSALGKLGWWYVKNFGLGYCEDVSVFARFAVDKRGFHPLDVEQVLLSEKNRGWVMDLLKRSRQRIVEVVLRGSPDDFYTDGSVEDEEDNLSDRQSWEQVDSQGGRTASADEILELAHTTTTPTSSPGTPSA
eukprot:g7628.t1